MMATVLPEQSQTGPITEAQIHDASVALFGASKFAPPPAPPQTAPMPEAVQRAVYGYVPFPTDEPKEK